MTNINLYIQLGWYHTMPTCRIHSIARAAAGDDLLQGGSRAKLLGGCIHPTLLAGMLSECCLDVILLPLVMSERKHRDNSDLTIFIQYHFVSYTKIVH